MQRLAAKRTSNGLITASEVTRKHLPGRAFRLESVTWSLTVHHNSLAQNTPVIWLSIASKPSESYSYSKVNILIFNSS